jgi:hypothetical protein
MFSAANEIHLRSRSGSLNAGVAEDLAPLPHPALSTAASALNAPPRPAQGVLG